MANATAIDGREIFHPEEKIYDVKLTVRPSYDGEGWFALAEAGKRPYGSATNFYRDSAIRLAVAECVKAADLLAELRRKGEVR